MLQFLAPYPIPYVCQFATPGLVHAFLYEGHPIERDPAWRSYGAHSPQEYAYWAVRSCGVVCVKMAVEGITGASPRPVMDWIMAGLALDGYLTELRPDRPDRPVEKGWKHAALAALAVSRGCRAWLAAGLTLADVVSHLRQRCVVIASVTSELGEDGPLTRSSGHLVVVYGAEIDPAGTAAAVIVHNPSGRTAALQAGARIPAVRFMQGFSGRGIVIGAESADSAPTASTVPPRP